MKHYTKTIAFRADEETQEILSLSGKPSETIRKALLFYGVLMDYNSGNITEKRLLELINKKLF